MENKRLKKDKFLKVCIQIFSLVAILILLFLGASAIIKTAYFENTYDQYTENILYKTDNIFINILLVAFFMIILYIIYLIFKKTKNKNLLIGLVIFYCIASIIWVFVSKAPLRADQKFIQEIAKQFIEGNYGMLEEGQYLCYHPLQLGIIYFLEIIYRLCSSTNPIIFQILNIIFSSVAMIFMYKISKIIFNNDKVQKILIFLLAGNLIMIFFNVYVYGNTVGLMLGIIAIYYALKYIKDKKVRNLIISTISIVISVVLKSNYEIYLIGIAIIYMVEIIKKWDYKPIISIVVAIILISIANKSIVKITEMRYGKEINEGIPMVSYIHMGMAEKVDRAAGWYNAFVNVEVIFKDNEFNPERASEYSKQEIIKRLEQFYENPKDAIIYYQDKILSTWIEPSFQTIWINEPQEEIDKVKDYISDKKILISLYDGKLNELVMKYLDIYDIIIFVFTAIYLIINFKEINIQKVSLVIMFFGGFVFHILWETKSIYAIPFFELLIPYAAYGINSTYEKIEELVKQKRSEY